MREEYFSVNKSLWNLKTPIHLKSAFYDLESFMKGKSSLNSVELEALGDVAGKSLLHLQCHFGLDSLSLARTGAKVTGIDMSDESIKAAKRLNKELGLDAEFICTNLYDLRTVLNKKFDLIFTSYGVLGWLPDLDKWAGTVSGFLNKGGSFYIVEFHPVLWMFNEDFEAVEYSYFNTGEIREELSSTYADRTAPFSHLSYQWNHSLGDVFASLMKHGLMISEFKEYPFSSYGCFKESMQVKHDEGKWYIRGLENKLPMMFSIKAYK